MVAAPYSQSWVRRGQRAHFGALLHQIWTKLA